MNTSEEGTSATTQVIANETPETKGPHTPVIGDMVHYWPASRQQPYPAIIAEVLMSIPELDGRPTVNLIVFTKSGTIYRSDVRHSTVPSASRWTWIQRA
jgi:hypothetical protein